MNKQDLSCHTWRLHRENTPSWQLGIVLCLLASHRAPDIEQATVTLISVMSVNVKISMCNSQDLAVGLTAQYFTVQGYAEAGETQRLQLWSLQHGV